jgi:MFS family permease
MMPRSHARADTLSDRLSARLMWTLWLPYACAYFISYWLRNVNAILAPELTREFQLNASDLGLLTSMYSLVFAASQLSGGMLLDRYGPRRVNAALLLAAVAGCAVMAASQAFAQVAFGRALAGFGVSMCLMASIKAFSTWFPPSRLPLTLSLLMMVGGIGGLVATAPVGWALQWMSWRAVFAVAALVLLGFVLLLHFVAPDRRGAPGSSPESLRSLLAGFVPVFRSRDFWRINLMVMAMVSTFNGVLSVWIGPWLSDVAGYARDEVVAMVTLYALAVAAGFALYGAVADSLMRRGWTALRIFKVHCGLLIAVFALIVAGGGGATLLWVVYFTIGTGGAVFSTLMTRLFASHLSGRANSAANMLSFASIFAMQWGIGIVLDFYPAAPGHYAAQGFQHVFYALLGLQVLLYVALILPMRPIAEARLSGHRPP